MAAGPPRSQPRFLQDFPASTQLMARFSKCVAFLIVLFLVRMVSVLQLAIGVSSAGSPCFSAMPLNVAAFAVAVGRREGAMQLYSYLRSKRATQP
jgi:hypothetical protein